MCFDRYFGRKYPIQLIVKNNHNEKASEDPPHHNVPTETFHTDSGFVELSLPKVDKTKRLSAGKIDLPGDGDVSETNKKSDSDNVMDFGAVVLNSDVSFVRHLMRILMLDSSHFKKIFQKDCL